MIPFPSRVRSTKYESCLSHPRGTAITFINRSSIQQTYAVRLGRTYLGATNPERRRDRIWGQDVTEVMPGDDLALRAYTPAREGRAAAPDQCNAESFHYRHFTRLTKLRWTFARFFLPQDLLLNEFLGRFGGPWVRYWYLSDGGFFENLGVYELLRRRVPYILCCDAGEDSEYDFVDLANLIRKARIDFAADIRFLTAEEIQNSEHIPGQVKPLLGPLEGLKPAGQGSHSQRHAALALIRYDDDPTPRSALLYLKSSLTGTKTPTF